jgi:hypothetical protein
MYDGWITKVCGCKRWQGLHDNEDPRDKDQHVNDDDKNLHDIKENIESYELHDNMDLPTKWNINDKSDSLSVSSDGLKVEYTGGNY